MCCLRAVVSKQMNALNARQIRAALLACLTTASRTLPEEAFAPSSAVGLWSRMAASVLEQPSVRALLPLLLAHAQADGAPPADARDLASAALHQLQHSPTSLWGVRHADTADVLHAAAAAMQRCTQDELQSGLPPSTSAEYLPGLAAWLNGVKAAALCARLVATLADGAAVAAGSSAPLLEALEQWAGTLRVVNKARDKWTAAQEDGLADQLDDLLTVTLVRECSYWQARLADALLRVAAKPAQFFAVVAAAAGTPAAPRWAARLLDACLEQTREPLFLHKIAQQHALVTAGPAGSSTAEQRAWLALSSCRLSA